MKLFRRIKELVSRKPFKLGDRVKCPHCGIVITMVRFEKPIHKNAVMCYGEEV